jgi:hypothetical protein
VKGECKSIEDELHGKDFLAKKVNVGDRFVKLQVFN